MKDFYINNLNVNEEIVDFFLVKSISIRVGSNRKQYLDLTLGDSTGEINGKKWDIADEEVYGLSRIAEGDCVKVKASVSEWNGIRQLRITKIRKAQKEDKLDMTDYIKAAPENPEEMFNFVYSKAESIGDDDLKRMALRFLNESKEKLLYYPGAMRNHHAEQAGLIYHVKRMLMLGELACSVYTNLDKDWVICGVILHDMEKLTEILSNELGISPGYSFEGKLLGHLVLGVRKVAEMAKEEGIPEEKAVMLEHMVISHHYEPEFGSPIKPMFPEAELLHYLDMLDAKMFDFEDNLASTAEGTFSERVRTLDGRMLYKPSFKKD